MGVGRKRRRRLREGELEGNGEEEVVVEDGEVCSCRCERWAFWMRVGC